MDSKQIGIWGEKIAENYLKKKGYRILDKNYSSSFASGPKRGEIDIIAKKSDAISFIEVKTIFQKNEEQLPVFSPEEKVNWLKRKKIIKTAYSWLIKRKVPLDAKWQIDVISLKLDLNAKSAKLRHLKNIAF